MELPPSPGAWLEIRRPTGASPKVTSERQSKGGSDWEDPVPPSLHFSESNQLSERGKKTDYLAVYLADRQASPTSTQGGRGRQSDVSDFGPSQQCPPPHSWLSPSLSAQEQGADDLSYHALLPTPKRAKGQSGNNASLSSSCQPQDISRQTQTPRPKPLQQKGGESRRGRSRVLRRPQESGLDWPGHRQGKGNKQIHSGEHFST